MNACTLRFVSIPTDISVQQCVLHELTEKWQPNERKMVKFFFTKYEKTFQRIAVKLSV